MCLGSERRPVRRNFAHEAPLLVPSASNSVPRVVGYSRPPYLRDFRAELDHTGPGPGVESRANLAEARPSLLEEPNRVRRSSGQLQLALNCHTNCVLPVNMRYTLRRIAAHV